MTVCTTKSIEYSRCHSRKVQANFSGGEITLDGGVMLLQQADRLINLTDRIASREFNGLQFRTLFPGEIL